MDIFAASDYRSYLKSYLQSLPNEGFGELAKMAKAMGIHPSLITVILKEQKQLTVEQASDLADYLGLTELEADFFILLVQSERAGKPSLKKRLVRQLGELKKKSRELKDRLPDRKEMTSEAKAMFYSQWYFSGIRMLTSLEGEQSAEKLAQRLSLPRPVVIEALQFLASHGLIVEKSGRYHLGPSRIHVPSGDPLVYRHHSNWRLKAITKFPNSEGDELHFTGPLSIATQDIEKVRSILLAAIDEIFKIVDPSPSEEVACLNIDWFRF